MYTDITKEKPKFGEDNPVIVYLEPHNSYYIGYLDQINEKGCRFIIDRGDRETYNATHWCYLPKFK